MDNTYAFKIPGSTVSITVTPDVVEAPVVEAPVETVEAPAIEAAEPAAE